MRCGKGRTMTTGRFVNAVSLVALLPSPVWPKVNVSDVTVVCDGDDLLIDRIYLVDKGMPK